MTIAPPLWEVPSVPIAGAAGRFPVRHIYCVGRNYAEHAKEMGGDATKEPPFFFTKPADAVVPVVPPDVGRVRYPLATKNYHHEIELVVAIGASGVRLAPERRARDGLGLRRRARHDAPRPAERHAREEAAVGHRQVVRARRRRSGRSIRSPRSDIRRSGKIWLDVNGARRQQGDLADMIWDVAAHDRLPVAVLRAPAGRSHLHGDARGRRGGRAGRSPRRRHRRPRHARGRPSRRRRVAGGPVTVYTAEVRRARLQQSRRGPRPSALARAITPESSAKARRGARAASSTCATGRARRRRSISSCLPVAPRERFVFLHGGYWRALDKSDFSFVAPPFVARGYAVAVVNYDLCPDVSIATIVDECRRAPWLARRAKAPRTARIRRGSSSAGIRRADTWPRCCSRPTGRAHGFAREPFLGGVSLSGVHDLEPMVHFSFNADFRLDAARGGADVAGAVCRRDRARRSCSRSAPTKPPNSSARREYCGTLGPRTARRARADRC